MALKTNLVIDQGSTWNTTILIAGPDNVPVDLTNYTAASQIRKHFSSANATPFTTVVGGASGTISLSLTSGQTMALAGGRYVFDVEITSNTGYVTRVIEGIVTINPNVTRP